MWLGPVGCRHERARALLQQFATDHRSKSAAKCKRIRKKKCAAMRDRLLSALKQVTVRWEDRAARVDLSNMDRHVAMLLDDYLEEIMAYVRQLQNISVEGTSHEAVNVQSHTKRFHVPALACAVLAYYNNKGSAGPFTFTSQLIFKQL